MSNLSIQTVNKNQCIHELFELQVERASLIASLLTPDAIAAVFEDKQLTYHELNCRANQLAHHLQSLGVGPEVLVGICLERSLEMLIGLLGILKAGGAYVPLDPAFPLERLAFVLEDAQVSLLLTQKHLAESLPKHQARVIYLDTEWELIAQQNKENPTSEVTPDNLAYAIYTSGSTGKPKGVQISHRAVVNFLNSMRLSPGLTEEDILLAVTTITFDIAALELFLPLAVGARVVITSREVASDGLQLSSMLLASGATVMQATPASWQLLLRAGWQGSKQLKILCGGEALPHELANQLLKKCASLWNLYGPTETTIWSTICQVDGNSSRCIGRPIANTEVYLLNEQMQTVLVGVPGELYIGGAGLARGYLNRPELTAERFIPNPFSNELDARLYKTGDLARYLPDGNIEYIGRIDHQVKIRGFRIELGEIEAALSQHPNVQDAVVIAREDIPGDKRLVGYIVSNLIPDRVPYQSSASAELDGRCALDLTTQDISLNGVCLVGVPPTWKQGQNVCVHLLLPVVSEARSLEGKVAWREGKRAGVQLVLTPTEQTLLTQSFEYLLEQQGFLKMLQRTVVGNLRSFLQQKLPNYMVPSSFVFLNALPLTPNGKIDRKALPAPDRIRHELEEDFAAPRTPIEEVLAGIWSEVLGLERVGIQDNFLELGGHSLLATQIISRLRDIYQVELSVRQLFDRPTVAGLAESIETICSENPGLQAPLIQPVGRDFASANSYSSRNLPLSFAQERLWFLDQLMPENPFYNVIEAVRLAGSLNAIALEQSLNEIIKRHETLRTIFTTVDGQPVQVIQDSYNCKLSVVNLQRVPKTEREALVLQLATKEAQQLFDLTKGPLLRFTLLQLDEQEYILLLNLHHILCDDWSLGVLFEELTDLYQAFSTGKPSPLPELGIQYADFAIWQRQWLEEVQPKQLAYWQQQLAELPSLQLPTDRPRPAVPTYRGALQSVVLPKTLTAALKALSQQEGVTLYMTLLAAFQTLLFRYTSSEDIPVGSAIANRHQPNVQKLIGFFANTVVLRTDLSGSPSFLMLLARVREVALAAYAYQDLPFEKLVAQLQPERDLSRQPLFQVVFALQNVAPITGLKLPGLETTSVQIDNGTAKFDLFLQLSDTPEGLSGWIEYSADLFDAATISRMTEHFQTLLEGIVANPEQRISDLPLLREAERHQLLVEWNDTQTDYSLDACIHQLFEAQVEQTPDAVAVVFEQEQLTYRELNCRANQLAHHLKTLGVEPGVLVGICIERSVEMIVGMLGVLKAGGAYLPLDPAYPPERLAFMLEDAQVLVLLTQEQWVERLRSPKSQVICLDKNWETIAQKSEANLNSNVISKNLAYVIYTSGSTGIPKGVQIEHRGLLNLVFWHQRTFAVSPLDRVTQIAGVAFDACGWEIWPYITAGASIHIPNNETRLSPELLQAWLVSKAITISFLPTPLAETVLLLDWPNNAALRILLTGGDRLHQYPLASHRFQLVNNYGPTENTVVTTSAIVPASNQANVAPTIGRPISNTQVYILDGHLQPVPVRVPGELYISGASLARGYLNRPDLTAERFIANPFSNDPEARLYKTGDLARYLPDGNIEFLGRIDHQVKIRGFRIELGEIQSVLSQHPAVQTAAVIDREDVPGQKRLVAYLVQKLQSDKVSDELPHLDSDYISQWRSLYEETYSQTATNQDATFNIIGWNSSYTGLPIPEAEMREWVDYTVNRILSLQPSRVLEIGCGTGLLLSRIAPHCIQYWGMDFSQEAIQYLEQLKRHKPELEQVTLLQRTADNFEGIEPDTFDTVILNSVVQYFPNIDYLLQVLKSAVNAVRCGGFIFLGDIRSLPLLEAYHASVELHQAPDSLTRSQFFGRIQQRIAQEEELVIDPAFFIALKQHLPKIADVQIQLKQGRYHNELTRFRYDVVLQVGSEVPPAVDIPWLDWHQQNLTLPALRRAIAQTQPEIIGVRGVPNARLLAEVHTLEWLSSSDRHDTIGELRSEKLQQFQDAGVDPEILWSLSHDLPYSIDITWSQFGANGCYDVVFKHHTKAATLIPAFKDTVPVKPWHCYGNKPLQGKLAQNLIPQIRRFLQDKLPGYMIPSAFVLLDALPVTPNGKLDRSALPAPEKTRVKVEEDFVASRTPLEEQIVSLWTKVLGIENIGINENFFELGGNSLLAAQLIAYVRQTFRVELPVRYIFEKPTVEGLAQIIQRIHKEGISAIATAIDFNAEAVLAPEIFPQGTPTDDVSEPSHIFLTGATGFVGAFLLHELLEQTQAKIYCLIRSANEQEAAKRLQTNLEKYLLWNPSQSSRIIPIMGELDRPLLGLSAEQFERLALQVDTIYHNGAQVNFAKPYSTIKAANVGGTQEVLRLACMGKTKPVHYISTCGIYGPIGYFTGPKVIKEDEDIGIAKDYLSMDVGYSQSKWVAEKLVDIAKSRKLPVSIYRLGFVMGDTKTGVTNTTDYMSRMIKGCIQLGSFPDIVDQKQEFVSVDYVTKAIVHLSSQKESLGKAFHLVPLPSQNIDLVKLFELISSYGYQLKKLPYTQWKDELTEQTQHSQENALYPLVPMITERVYQDSFSIVQLYQNTPGYDCKNTLDGLAGTSIACPAMDDKLIETYFSYFIRSGFLEPPKSSNHLKTSVTTEAIL
jgi:amino acid adenylation domain-containing protein/thioester reductase-like protein